MTPHELLNPNLHLTFTVKLGCDNKAWRKNVAEWADGDAEERRKALLDAITEAVAPILTGELGKDATACAETTLAIVDDDKAPIYSYNWTPISRLSPRPELTGMACTPMHDGKELPFRLFTRYVIDSLTVFSVAPENCHPEEGHNEWDILDSAGNLLERGEGDEDDCQRRFEEIMKEETK